MKHISKYSASELERLGVFPSITETYNWIKSNPEDQRGKDSIQWIAHYMEVLYSYAKKCEHVTEMGINQVNSTWAFLAAQPKKVVSIDLDLYNRPTKNTSHKGVNIWLQSAQELAAESGIEFEALEADTSKICIEETDLLFIDTEHSFECLTTELELHGNKAGKYIILHDTTLYSLELQPAIKNFKQSNPHWEVELEFKDKPGLTILKRIK